MIIPEKPAVLPRIMGVAHSASKLESVLKEIRSLPPKSNVYLEADRHQFLPPNLRAEANLRLSTKKGNPFFSTLADEAERLGHRVVWLDSPRVMFVGQTKLIREAEKRLSKTRGENARNRLFDSFVRKLSDRNNFLWYYRDQYLRTRQFARTFRLHPPQRPTDLAISGTNHAAVLEDWWNIQPEYPHGKDVPVIMDVWEMGKEVEKSLAKRRELRGKKGLARVVTRARIGLSRK